MNKFLSATSMSDNTISYKTSLILTLVVYVVIYSVFLWANQYLPYVFDNNETFSSLIHAQNMFHFGVRDTFGLTDESNSLMKAAHPFVYTHQGNFPRFYTLLLYVLGARSPELQIVLTTFTIGLAGMWLCHRFFAKYVSSLFALILCLLLMTDYLMFAQWNVNTWRVWHLFFFFSSFLCGQKLIEKCSKSFILLTIINFICLFYMEIVYAVFVASSCCFYLLFQQRVSFPNKIRACFIIGVGGLLGVSILVAQNIAYLGWADFLKDLTFTYTARNSLVDGVSSVVQFYHDHNLVFWENFNSKPHIRNLSTLIKNFYIYCFLPYSPFITLAALITFLSSLTNIFAFKIRRQLLTKSISYNVLFILSGLFYLICGLTLLYLGHKILLNHFLYKILILSFITVFSMLGLLSWVFEYKSTKNFNSTYIRLIPSFLDKKQLSIVIFLICNVILLMVFIALNGLSFVKAASVIIIFLSCNVSIFYWSILKKDDLFNLSNKITMLMCMNFFICLAYLSLSNINIPENVMEFTHSLLTPKHWYVVIYLFSLVILLYCAIKQIFSDKRDSFSFVNITFNMLLVIILMVACSSNLLNEHAERISDILKNNVYNSLKGSLQILSILSMLLIINISFLRMMNNTRYIAKYDEPVLKNFMCFFVATMLGFIVAYMLFPGYVRTGYLVRVCCFTVFAHIGVYAWLFYVLTVKSLFLFKFAQISSGFEKIIGALALTLFFVFAYLWINLQVNYIKEFPASGLQFIKILSKSPYYHQPLIANNYATPFAYITQMWGYYDQDFSQSQYSMSQHSFQAKHDYRYLWYADSKSSVYMNPSYFICWMGYTFDSMGQHKPKCQDLPFIQYVRGNKTQFLHGQEIMRDHSNQDRWAIVKLH